MEFLAESIGLLDMDGEGAAVYDSSRPHHSRRQKKKGTAILESNANPTNSNTAAAATTSRSFSFFPWGESSSETHEEQDTTLLDSGCSVLKREPEEDSNNYDGDDFFDDDNDDSSNNNNILDHHSGGGEYELKYEQEEEEEPRTSSSPSLASSLTPTSPLTLSASSLNSLSAVAANTTDAMSEMYAVAGNNNNSYVLTKHVTQRIDARTNYDCFTGDVDAVTGHLIHGTMLYRRTGDVYEGPFLTQYVTSANTNINNDVAGVGQCNEGTAVPEIVATTKIASLRHGVNATCQYSNGMKFVGSFEYDRPKAGTWIGINKDWTYEGPLLAVAEEDQNDRNAILSSKNNNITPSPPPLSASASISSSNSYHLKVIGIPHSLPGAVLFHGNGQFARHPSDGLVYRGEFVSGLADGVGKETMPNGRGVYYGEFRDGLRHGVGTLIEDYEEEESESGGQEEERDCQQSREEHGASSSVASINGDQQSTDQGPDFAAGCTTATTQTSSTRQCQNPPGRHRSHRQHQHQIKTKKKIKRYSSGVWCAGQYEIEDCRGTVHPENNEFMEERAAGTITASPGTTPRSDANDDGNNESSASSLNRTTWDMLDEKWLGV